MSAARGATPQDATELARLRLVMLSAEHPVQDPAFAEQATGWFHDQLTDNPRFAAFVVPSDNGLISCAAGLLHHHPPRPGTAPLRGHILSVTTDPQHRRRGHARTCVSALLGWLIEQGAAAVTLTSSHDGHALYRDLGFASDTDEYLVWRGPPASAI